MSAPFSVWVNTAGDHHIIECATLAEAIMKARKVKPRRHRIIRIIGDDYDCDFEYGRGYFECNDGLTDRERERVERAGFGR